jgi:hypothetical protein
MADFVCGANANGYHFPQVRQLEQEIRPVVVVPLPEINELLSDFGGFVLCHAIAI